MTKVTARAATDVAPPTLELPPRDVSRAPAADVVPGDVLLERTPGERSAPKLETMAPPRALARATTAGVSLALQQRFGRALETFGADPATRDALVARLAALPWGQTLQFDPTDSAAVMRALPRIRETLKAGFHVDSGDAPISLADVAVSGRANCFGSSQIFLSLADALGLEAQPIQVTEANPREATLHVASLVRLPDGRSATVDVLYPDAVSPAFDFNASYAAHGQALRRRSDDGGAPYAEVRPLTRDQYRAFIASQSPPRVEESARPGRDPQAESDTRYAEAAIALDPGNPWLRTTLADALERSATDRFESTATPENAALHARAAEALEEATRLAPDNAQVFIDLARLQRKTAAYTASADSYARALGMVESSFVERARAVVEAPNATLTELVGSPRVTTEEFGGTVETLIALRLERAQSLLGAGDKAAARDALREAKALAEADSDNDWFAYYSGDALLQRAADSEP